MIREKNNIKYYNLVLNTKIKLYLTRTLKHVFLIFKYFMTYKNYTKWYKY